MSHYSLIATQMKSKPHLVKALQGMGFQQVEVHDRPVAIQGFGSTRNQAEIIIRAKTPNAGTYDLGFRRSAEGGYIAVIEDLDRKHFSENWMKEVSRQYAYHVAMDTLQEQGFSLVSENVGEDRSIHLTVRRMT